MNACPNCGRINREDMASCVCGTVLGVPDSAGLNIDRTPRITKAVNASLVPMTIVAEDDRRRTRAIDEFYFAVIGFADEARIALPLTRVSQVDGWVRREPSGGTNHAEAIDLCGQLLRDGGIQRACGLMGTDGVSTRGGSLFKRDSDAAIEQAAALMNSGVVLSAIGISGGTSNYDMAFLSHIVNSPSLLDETGVADMVERFFRMSMRATQSIGTTASGSRAFILMLDESASMSEGNKYEELDRVVQAVLSALRQVQ